VDTLEVGADVYHETTIQHDAAVAVSNLKQREPDSLVLVQMTEQRIPSEFLRLMKLRAGAGRTRFC
jgi:hypothetical protein